VSRYRQCLDERELFVGTAAVERELFVVLLRLRESCLWYCCGTHPLSDVQISGFLDA